MTASMITESLKRKLSFAELHFQPARKVRVVCDKTLPKSESQSQTGSLSLTQCHRKADQQTTQTIPYPQSGDGVATIPVGHHLSNVKDSKALQLGSISGRTKVRGSETVCHKDIVSVTDCLPKPTSTHNKRTAPFQESEIESKCHLNKRRRVDGIMAPVTQWNSMLTSHHIQTSEFNAFNFWKPCLPDIELELAEFLTEKMELSDDNNRKDIADEENPKFNSFNFWRDPLPDVDFLDS